MYKNTLRFLILTISRDHEHYYTSRPRSVKKEYAFTTNVLGIVLHFSTTSGIFSPRRLDRGTLTLMKNMRIKPGDRVLDMGCGYGALGITAAKICKGCDVLMVDVNERAVEAAKKNIVLNGAFNARAQPSVFYDSIKDGRFDVILSNLPMSAGLDTCYKILTGSKEHLFDNGNLQVVSRQRKGGGRIMLKMRETFGNVEVIAKSGGYWVYKSEYL